jgi:quinol monooxygenase YgiN
MFIILVPIRIEKGYKEPYLEALKVNATASVRTEPGVMRFDIIQDAHDDDVIWLYEVYRDEEAFNTHRESEHFLNFYTKWRPRMEVLPHGAELGPGNQRGTHQIWPPDDEWY